MWHNLVLMRILWIRKKHVLHLWTVLYYWKTKPLFDFCVQCETFDRHLATRQETEKCCRRDVNKSLNKPVISQTLWCYGTKKLLSTPAIQFYRYWSVAFKKIHSKFLIELLHTKAIWKIYKFICSQSILFIPTKRT